MRWKLLDSYGCLLKRFRTIRSALEFLWLEPGDREVTNHGGGVYEIYIEGEGTYTLTRHPIGG